MNPTVNDRVRWTYTDVRRGKAVESVIEGTVVDRPTRNGWLAVVSDDGQEHHVQPSFVEVVG